GRKVSTQGNMAGRYFAGLVMPPYKRVHWQASVPCSGFPAAEAESRETTRLRPLRAAPAVETSRRKRISHLFSAWTGQSHQLFPPRTISLNFSSAALIRNIRT